MNKKIKFKIESIDPLGQGVSKLDEKATFIAKTLPGESGVASIYRAAKGVQFATIESLEIQSEKRVKADCPHFNICNGCHFLHTSYQEELHFKEISLKHILRDFPEIIKKIDVIGAPSRLNYRNRVQLHYDQKKGVIGYINPILNKIIEVPQCKIISPEVSDTFKSLYEKPDLWRYLKMKDRGHVELYLLNGVVNISWNERYAYGGFTQVNSAMNLRLQQLVAQMAGDGHNVLELFGGNGNLSKLIDSNHNTIVDLYEKLPNQQTKNKFINCDLYGDMAINEVFENINYHPQILLLDPPRKGVPEIDSWVNKANPQKIIYVSCNPWTMARDITKISSKYSISSCSLLDLFPSTNHFETVTLLEKII